MKRFVQASITAGAFLAPLVSFAAVDNGGLGHALDLIGGLISTATPIVVALALLGFFWGLAVYIFSAGNEKKKSEGRNIMIWGILALFVMLSVFGIIATLQSTLGLVNNQTIDIPQVQTNSSGGGVVTGQ